MTQTSPSGRDDLLEEVAHLLDHMASDPEAAYADADRTRFCRDVGDWVRAVREEMDQLRRDFERGIHHDLVARTTADAVDRIAGHASSLAERVRAALAAPQATAASSATPPAEESPKHVEQAEQIRSSVAEFRERLRAERAERARLAAEERKRFVESIRRAPRPDPNAESGDASAGIPNEVEPSDETAAPVSDGTAPAQEAVGDAPDRPSEPHAPVPAFAESVATASDHADAEAEAPFASTVPLPDPATLRESETSDAPSLFDPIDEAGDDAPPSEEGVLEVQAPEDDAPAAERDAPEAAPLPEEPSTPLKFRRADEPGDPAGAATDESSVPEPRAAADTLPGTEALGAAPEGNARSPFRRVDVVSPANTDGIRFRMNRSA